MKKLLVITDMATEKTVNSSNERSCGVNGC